MPFHVSGMTAVIVAFLFVLVAFISWGYLYQDHPHLAGPGFRINGAVGTALFVGGITMTQSFSLPLIGGAMFAGLVLGYLVARSLYKRLTQTRKVAPPIERGAVFYEEAPR